MTFTRSIRTVFFQKYATFKGRAQRSEYWWWALAIFLISSMAQGFDIAFLASEVRTSSGPGSFSVEHNGPLGAIVTLATILPNLAVMVRRLHDSDKSGWWFFIVLVPIFGMIYFLYLLIRRGTDGPNRFGPDPLDPNPYAYEDWQQSMEPAAEPYAATAPMSPEEEALRRRASMSRATDMAAEAPTAASDAKDPEPKASETRRSEARAPKTRDSGPSKDDSRPSWRTPSTGKDGFQTTQERFKDK